MQRDNVIVALKFDYAQDDIGWRESEVGIACALILSCLVIQVGGHLNTRSGPGCSSAVIIWLAQAHSGAVRAVREADVQGLWMRAA